MRLASVIFLLSFQSISLIGQNNNSTNVSGSGQINVNGTYAPGATIIYNDPSKISKSTNANLSSKETSDCQMKNYGDACFVNQNNYDIHISLVTDKKGIEWRSISVTIPAHGTKCAYGLAPGGYNYYGSRLPDTRNVNERVDGRIQVERCQSNTFPL